MGTVPPDQSRPFAQLYNSNFRRYSFVFLCWISYRTFVLLIEIGETCMDTGSVFFGIAKKGAKISDNNHYWTFFYDVTQK